MKKIIVSLLVLVLALGAFAACGKKDEAPKTSLTGSANEVFEAIDKTVAPEIMMPTVGDVVADGVVPVFGTFGLTETEFKDLVLEGTYQAPMVSSTHHYIIMIKAKDVDSAKKIKETAGKFIADYRWVCGSPEAYYINDSADYVFIAVSVNDYVEKYGKTFEEMAKTFGTAISGKV